jgi:hypothetical protein
MENGRADENHAIGAKWNAGAFSSETLEKASRFLRADGTLVLHKQLM